MFGTRAALASTWLALVCLASYPIPAGAQEEDREREKVEGARVEAGGEKEKEKEPSGSAIVSRRLLYGGEVSANIAPTDPGHFNATEYGRDGLRLFRLNLALELRAAESLSFLTEIRSDNLDAPRPYALYVRFRPWKERELDIQGGRIPPVFGKFSRRRYELDNPLIGYPLPYQYPTILRADSAPAKLYQLLDYRGYGSYVRYPVGNTTPDRGLSQLDPLKWDTGVEVRLGRDPVALAVAVTQGTISNPLVRDDNGGKQIAGRLGVRPFFGVELGISASRGDYVADGVKVLLPEETGKGQRDTHQTALGLDAELSRGRWLVSGEAIWTAWDVPTLTTSPLSALGWVVEGRYKVFPGFWLAGRLTASRFESIDTPEGRLTWDFPVTRVEAGVGYELNRYLLAKFAVQYDERAGGAIRSRVIPAVQVLFWF
jgi:hypothetical protein